MPTAVIVFDFDPLLRLAETLVVRWQTVGLAAVIAGVLIVVGVLARRSSLRVDDVLYIAVGVVPGAVIGGRVAWAFTHPDPFLADPLSLVDPAVPGLELAGGVVGGILSGTYVASLLGAPIGDWARLAALPLLLALAFGKATMILGGSGQGLPSDAIWATAFLGPGPWGSLAPALPSLPSQAFEGIATLVFAAILWALIVGTRPGDGRRLLVAVAGWAIIRAGVSVTWRDPTIVGPFGATGLLAIGVAVATLGLLATWGPLAARRGRASVREAESLEPRWPDPEARPRF